MSPGTGPERIHQKGGQVGAGPCWSLRGLGFYSKWDWQLLEGAELKSDGWDASFEKMPVFAVLTTNTVGQEEQK